MQVLPNEIVLRPRFQIELEEPKEKALQTFENSNPAFAPKNKEGANIPPIPPLPNVTDVATTLKINAVSY